MAGFLVEEREPKTASPVEHKERTVIYWQYLFSELRRRKARSLLTAMGLGVGVALVVIVSALSNGLDDAQSEVLEPLTGVGTEMTVTRTIDPGDSGGDLSDEERDQLRDENRPGRVGFDNLGDPGEKFTREEFMAGTNLSFDDAELASVAKIDGVEQASAGLNVQLTTITGTVPEQTASGSGAMGGPPAGGGGPESIDFASISVTGVDQAAGELGPIKADQITDGEFFGSGDDKQAIVSAAYAEQESLKVGENVELKDHEFKVVGIVSAPLGGTASDVYIKLDQLQKIAGMGGRVNAIYARAADADSVATAASAIEKQIDSATVTTSQTLAERVGGSVVDARKLADKLGFALVIAALISSVLVAVLLTLSAVAKRTRELGTLKAIGWSGGRVVRQVGAESIAQGALGGLIGIALGALGALAVSAAGITMQASVSSASAASGAGGGGGMFGPGGPLGGAADAVVSGSESVTVGAPLDPMLIAVAFALAVLGGAVAGAAGGMRTARLRPAEALRNAD